MQNIVRNIFHFLKKTCCELHVADSYLSRKISTFKKNSILDGPTKLIMLEIQMIVATAVIGLCVGFFFYIVKLFNQEQESSSTGIENSANDIIKSNTDGDISKPRRKSESVSQSCDRKWGKNLQK